MAVSKRLSASITIALTAILTAIVVVVSLYVVKFIEYDRYEKHDFIEPDTYQAVFLTNDQIYFGHLKNINSRYLLLYDVYYVKITESGAGQLVKLGVVEPHGPIDRMIINKDQLIFWENLKPDSTVVKTIQNMQLK
jgi:hypothetical protein